MQGRQNATQGYAGWGTEQDATNFGWNDLGKLGAHYRFRWSSETPGWKIGRRLLSPAAAKPKLLLLRGRHSSTRARIRNPIRDRDDQSMMVMNPDEQFHLPSSTTVLPLNPNRETSPNGLINPYYKLGRNMRPMFENLGSQAQPPGNSTPITKPTSSRNPARNNHPSPPVAP